MASLAKNTLFLTGASVLQKAVAFIYFAAIARTIGTTDTGSYFLALALVTTVGTLADAGLNSVLIRDTARTPEHTKDLLRRVLGVKIFAAPIAGIVAIFLPVLLGYSQDSVFLVRLAIGVMIADTFSLTMYGALRGAQELRYESLGIFIGQSLTTIVGVIVLFWVEASLPMLILALFMGSFWNMLYSAYQVGKRLGFDAFIPSWVHSKQLFLAAFPFFLAAIFVKLYSSFDSYTLKSMIGESAVGIYSVAYKLTYAFQFLPLAFIGALYPRMSSLVGKPEELKKVFLEAQWYLALLACPIVFGIFALAPEIIRVAYGANYAASVLPLSVLIFVLLPIFFDFPIGSLLNASGRQSTKTAIMGVTMVTNVVANLVCISRFGVVGASIAGCVTFVVMFSLGLFAMRKQIHVSLREWAKAIGGFLLAGISMDVVLFAIRPLMSSWFLLIPIGAVVFMAVSFLTKSITVYHLRHARRLFTPSYGTAAAANE